MAKHEVWISDHSNMKYQRIKSSFLDAMHEETSEEKINYYDFLLVAKTLSFRFEESAHLMALKNYFSKNKNIVSIKKIADLLCISQESIHVQEEKIIVKFTVPDTEFAPIKEQTHEDQEQRGDSEDQLQTRYFQKIGGTPGQEQREINQKMAIILTIKVDEMEKKIRLLINEKESINLLDEVRDSQTIQLNAQEFKGKIIKVINQLKETIKISEDDIKTLFFILDTSKKGFVTLAQIEELKNIPNITLRLKEFYKSRINKDMVKNTLFKLGKVKNNAIQIYQVKNASLLQFENIERSMIQENNVKVIHRVKQAKIPHFGPLKGAALANRQRQTLPSHAYPNNKGSDSSIRFERQRIEKILRHSKEQKLRDKTGDTVASKLRSLFIHKVILPRQKMLEQQKERYLKQKGVTSDLSIKPHR